MKNSEAIAIVEKAFQHHVNSIFRMLIANIEQGNSEDACTGLFDRDFARAKKAREMALKVASKHFPD